MKKERLKRLVGDYKRDSRWSEYKRKATFRETQDRLRQMQDRLWRDYIVYSRSPSAALLALQLASAGLNDLSRPQMA